MALVGIGPLSELLIIISLVQAWTSYSSVEGWLVGLFMCVPSFVKARGLDENFPSLS